MSSEDHSDDEVTRNFVNNVKTDSQEKKEKAKKKLAIELNRSQELSDSDNNVNYILLLF